MLRLHWVSKSLEITSILRWLRLLLCPGFHSMHPYPVLKQLKEDTLSRNTSDIYFLSIASDKR